MFLKNGDNSSRLPVVMVYWDYPESEIVSFFVNRAHWRCPGTVWVDQSFRPGLFKFKIQSGQLSHTVTWINNLRYLCFSQQRYWIHEGTKSAKRKSRNNSLSCVCTFLSQKILHVFWRILHHSRRVAQPRRGAWALWVLLFLFFFFFIIFKNFWTEQKKYI